MIEQLTNRYRILSLLGQGGMGSVFLAEDASSGDRVALKTLSLQSAGDPAEALVRFRQEFRAMARLRHPNIVEVYDFGQLDDGTPFFTMEVVEGCGLDERIPFPPDELPGILAQLCGALSFIHQQGLVHCDIKPENVRLTPEGRVKLMDFGLMSPTGQAGGSIKGTLAYIAPEVAKRAKVDARSDLYSLGAVAYHLLAGRPPFPGEDPLSVLKAHMELDPDPLRPLCPQVSVPLERTVMRLLEKDPMARYQSTYEVLADLGVATEEDDKGTLFSSPFVGRTRELSLFAERFEALGRKEASTLHVAGAPGQGKTRLLEELRYQAQLAGRLVLTGRSQEDALPYGPFVEVLRGAIASLPAEAVAPFRAPLAGLLPELADEGGHAALDPQKEKARLQNAVVDLLALVAKSSGLVVLMDDWHWADASSQELSDVLARTLQGQPVLVLTAGREKLGEGMELEAFGPDEVREMAEAILGSRDLDTAFIAQLHEATSGNPFFVESALRHLWQEGTLRRHKGQWVTAGLTLSATDLPSDVHDLLLKRIDQLSGSAVRVSEFAAAMGQPFAVSRLRRLVPGDDDALFEALAELASEGILREEEGVIRFAGGQHAELLYGRLSEEARTRIHSVIAAVLTEELAGDDRLEALFELARHHLLSDAPEGGVGYALEAARKSFALFGLAQAKQLLEAGLPHASDRAVRLSFLQLLGDIARFSSQLEPAEAYYAEALPIAQELGLHTMEASLLYNQGILFQIRSQYDPALEKIQGALAILETHPNPRETLRSLFAKGRLHNFKGEGQKAIETTERALVLAREVGDVGMESGCLGFLGLLYVHGAPDRIQTGLDYLEESKAIKERLGDKVGINDTLNLLGNAQMAIGRFADALASFERGLTLCQELGIRDDEICAMLNVGMMAYELGRFTVAVSHWQQAVDAAKGSGNVLYQGIGLVWLAMAHANTADLDHARTRLKEADALALETKNSYLDVTVATFGIEAELLLGRLVDALRRAERADALGKETGIHEYDAKLWGLKAELFTRLSEPALAEAEIQRMLEHAETNQALGVRARALVARAFIASRSDDPETWLITVEPALEAARECQAAYLEGFASWIHGSVLLRLGQGARARAAFELAAQRAKEAGCPRLDVLATFGFAQVERSSAKAHQILPKARTALADLLSVLDADAQEDVLSLDELWRVQQGDLAVALAGASDATGSGVSEGKYLTAVSELRVAQSQLEELLRANDSLQRMVNFAAEAQGMLDLPQLLDRIAGLVKGLVEADRGFVLMREDDKLRIKGSTLDYRDRNPRHWQFSETIAERAYQEGRAVFMQDASEDAGASRSVMDLQIRTVLCVPLIHRDQTVALVYVDRHTVGGEFSEDDRVLVESFASQAAQAIVNAQLHVESEARSRQLEMLNNLARTVSTTLVLAEVIDNIIDFTLKLTGADRAFILLTDDGEVLRCDAAKDRMGNVLTDSGEKVSMSITQRVLSTLEAECVLDTKDHERFAAQQSILDLNLRTVMCVPLMVKQEALGVLYVDSQAVVNAFTDRDLDLLRSIASQASVAIQNAKLYERATVDGLTRLYVRSYFEQRLSSELRRVLRYGGEVSLCMMDIDHFKKFNDTYGHATGDEVLKLVARVIKEQIRVDVDIPGRFGGEEMLVLMPETGIEGAMNLAERLRHAIETTDLPGPNGETLHVTVSMGVATVPLHAQTMVELVEFADQALYRSKRGGRNQVTLYDPAASEAAH